MDGGILPLNFYCRNARLCLKRAILSKRSHLQVDELKHLKAFETLVSATIPAHPLYSERKEDANLLDLQSHLNGAKKRIATLEANRQILTRNVKGTRRNSTKASPCRNGCHSPGLPSSRASSDSTSNSHKSSNKRQSHWKRPASPSNGKNPKHCNYKMHEAYGFVSRSAPSSRKSTPTLHRLRGANECFGVRGESLRRSQSQREREKEKSEYNVSLSRDCSSFRAKIAREMPRLKAFGLVSAIAGKNKEDKGVHIVASKKLGRNQEISGQDTSDLFPEESNTPSMSSPRIPLPSCLGDGAAHTSSSASVSDYTERHGRTVHFQAKLENIESLSSQSTEMETSISCRIKEMEANFDGADHPRQEGASWTTLRLQEQFGEALKELNSLQTNDQGCHEDIERRLHDRGANIKSQIGKSDEAANSEHLGTYREHVRGVKEDCQRFREQMKLLKEKAEDSRLRELCTETQIDRHSGKRRAVDEMEGRSESQEEDDEKESCRDPADAPGYRVTKKSLRSAKKDRTASERNSGMDIASESKESEADPCLENTKCAAASSHSPCSLNSSSVSSARSSSSGSSLPLSHYIQKLKHLPPEPKVPPSVRSLYPERYVKTPKPASSPYHIPHPFVDPAHTRQPRACIDYNQLISKCTESGESDGLPAAILLPTSAPSSQLLQNARVVSHTSPKCNNFTLSDIRTCKETSKERTSPKCSHFTSSDLSSCQQTSRDGNLDNVLGGCCAVVTNSLERVQDGFRNDKVTLGLQSNHICLTNFQRTDRSQKHRHKGDQEAENYMVSYASHKRNSPQTDIYDWNMASLHKLVGELKGTVEGFKIRIEVESESWRARIEGLEKELEIIKDETDEELGSIKRTIRNEVRLRFSELATDVERMRREEKEHLDCIVDEKIQNHLSDKELNSVNLKKELQVLWTEVEIQAKGREEVQSHVERLTKVADESRESAIREQDFLKSENGILRKQLQLLKKEIRSSAEDCKKETEAQRDDARHTLEKMKDEGSELKAEVAGFKKLEKLLKMEVENMRKMIEKMQEDAEELEREREALHMEGVRERLLIMERVESLSQLYLGGLEEVRTDVFNVKFSCRDWVDELESQWGEFKRLQENSSEEESACVQKRLLLHAMEHFRSEIGNIMETERECIRRKMMDICSGSENELECMVKVEVTRKLQAAEDKLERLRMDLEEGAATVGQALARVERERDIASHAAAEATASAAKAGEVLTDVLGSFSSEMATASRKSSQLHESLAHERDMAGKAVAEAKKRTSEMQEFIEQERTRIKVAMDMILRERDSAAAAASEASTSAVKAGEVLAEVLGSFTQEMVKARRKSVQLQEGLDQERETLEKDQEETLRRNQQNQEKLNEEMERTITGWKRAMNTEMAKAKSVTEELEEERRRASISVQQASLVGHQIDIRRIAQLELENHYNKTEEALSQLTKTVKHLQDVNDDYQQQKKRRTSVKQEALSIREMDWKKEISSLERRIDDAKGREDSLREIVIVSGTRIKQLEDLQMDLAESFQEVRASTGDLGKAASSWLPKYENAARVVNDLSLKMEKLEERFVGGFSSDDVLMQQISHLAESKVDGLRGVVASATDLEDLYQKVENGDRSHCQALLQLESRIGQLENSAAGEGGLSLKLDYVENDSHTMINLTQSVEDLQRKMDTLSSDKQREGNLELDPRLANLESRVEHVACATFTNLRLLDTKVEEVQVVVQNALQGAAMAESKCGALGAELVKVFRMLASSRQGGPAVRIRATSPSRTAERSTSPLKHDVRQSQLPLSKGSLVPRPCCRKIPKVKVGKEDFTRGTSTSEMRKATVQHERMEKEGHHSEDRSVSPVREGGFNKDLALAERGDEGALYVQDGNESKMHSHEFIMGEKSICLHDREEKGLSRLTISQNCGDEKQKDGPTNCQRTNIRLEAGRIHVNVSHRSGVRDKRADLVAVES